MVFAVFYVRVFSGFRFSQNCFQNSSTKQTKTYIHIQIQNAQINEQNTLRAIQQHNTVLCIFLSSLRKCLYKKHSQNTSKTLQNIRKTPQNTVFQKTLAEHHNTQYTTPAKHSQNTAKHRKTPQNTFANKTDRISQQTAPLPGLTFFEFR